METFHGSVSTSIIQKGFFGVPGEILWGAKESKEESFLFFLAEILSKYSCIASGLVLLVIV